MVYFNDFAPFSFEENNEMKGIFIDINNEVFGKKLGLKVVHAGYPWTRAQEMVKNGTADGFVTLPTAERMVYSKQSREPSVITEVFAYVSAKRVSEFQNVKHLVDTRKYRHCSYIGNAWTKINLVGFNIAWAPSQESVLQMIAYKRVDMYLGSKQGVDYNIKKLNLNDLIASLPVAFDTSAFYICISNQSKYQTLLPGIDKVLKQMRKDGMMKRIYQKYE